MLRDWRGTRARHRITGGQSWSQTAVVTSKGVGHWADLDDFQGTSKGGELEGEQLVKQCVFLNCNFK